MWQNYVDLRELIECLVANPSVTKYLSELRKVEYEEQAKQELEKLNNQLNQTYSGQLISEIEEFSSDLDEFSSNIPSLKKKIKYCKNPLERKQLQRKLNQAYKKYK